MPRSMPRSTACKPRHGCALLAVLMLSLAQQACTSPAPQTQRFLQHPELPAAAQAAPNFTRQILHALADAEARAQ